jgi:acylphosphatase
MGTRFVSGRPGGQSSSLVAKRVHVFVSGDVQGVGFRWYCREEALHRNLAGFVRNLPDGRVEAVFEGDPASVDEMVEWCRTGPNWARVEAVESSDEQPAGEDGFVITK